MQREYLMGVTIRDLQESDREKLKGLNFDYMLESEYKIIEKDNLFVVINKYDYETYGRERICNVVYAEHSNILDENFLKVDFSKIANDVEFNKSITIDVEFVCNKNGTAESIFKSKDKEKYYIRMDNSRENCAKWYSAFKKNDVYEDNAPIRANVTFKMENEIEKVTFTNWGAEGVYSENYNKIFSYEELRKTEIANSFKEIAKEFKFKIKEVDPLIVLCAKDTDKKWQEWITYNKDDYSISITGNSDQCNFWFCDTRKDLTPEKIIEFVDSLNNTLEKSDYIPLRVLIDPEDWQAIAKVNDAYNDIRYTEKEEPDICDDD